MTILSATHFTNASLSAVRVGAALARKRDEPLYLVNVQPQSGAAAHGRLREAAAHDDLKLEAARLAATGLEVATAVLHGPLGAAVARFCAEQKPRLAVVGDTNHPSSALFESPLDQLSHRIGVPLLVVRDDGPLLAWVRGARPLRVMLALDRTWSSALARDWVGRLSEDGPLEVVVSHIWWPPEEYKRRGLHAPPEREGHWALEQVVRREVEAALSELPSNVTHSVHLEIGHKHVAERLLKQSVDENVDLFVLGTHPEHGALARLWSVSRDVLGLAPMSVVCVPGAERAEEQPAAAAPEHAGAFEATPPPGRANLHGLR